MPIADSITATNAAKILTVSRRLSDCASKSIGFPIQGGQARLISPGCYKTKKGDFPATENSRTRRRFAAAQRNAAKCGAIGTV